MKSNNVSTCIYQRLVFIVLLVCFTLPVHAAIPNYLDYQGYLADSGGVPVNTTVSITFTLYSDAGGTTSVWTEVQNVIVSNGMFNVQLGSVTALTVTLFENPLWLGINVAGDGEITPLTEITSSAYAFKANDANTLDGFDSTDLVSASGSTMTGTLTLSGGAALEVAGAAKVGNLQDSDSTNFFDGGCADNQHVTGISDTGAITCAADSADIVGVTAGNGLAGGGTSGTVTLSHADTSAQASVNNSNGTVVQDVTLDANGHLTGLASYNLDGRYFTEAESNANYVNATGDIMTGSLSLPANGLVAGTDQLSLSAGNVGIGTNTPSRKLHVSGGESGDLGYFYNDNNVVSGGNTYGIYARGDAYGTQTGAGRGGYFNGTGGSNGGSAYGLSSYAAAYGTSTAYGVFSQATGGTTTGNEYAFYGVGKGYISSDLDVNGTAFIGWQRVTGSAVSLSSTAACSMSDSQTCYYAVATASCPTGKVVLGGGCDCSSSYNCYIGDNYASADNTWYCRGVASASGYTVTPSVTCARVGN